MFKIKVHYIDKNNTFETNVFKGENAFVKFARYCADTAQYYAVKQTGDVTITLLYDGVPKCQMTIKMES